MQLSKHLIHPYWSPRLPCCHHICPAYATGTWIVIVSDIETLEAFHMECQILQWNGRTASITMRSLRPPVLYPYRVPSLVSKRYLMNRLPGSTSEASGAVRTTGPKGQYRHSIQRSLEECHGHSHRGTVLWHSLAVNWQWWWWWWTPRDYTFWLQLPSLLSASACIPDFWHFDDEVIRSYGLAYLCLLCLVVRSCILEPLVSSWFGLLSSPVKMAFCTVTST